MKNGKYKLITSTQVTGTEGFFALDYAFQATSFEAYENLTWKDDLIEDTPKNGVGTIYLVPAKDQLTKERYMLHIEAIEDSNENQEEGEEDDYIWRVSLYKKVA
jgi:hypothetical protein|tara:strand:- start:254 stop:565 length:312 start_codon:yes stop_codon:yes gene_type:complete